VLTLKANVEAAGKLSGYNFLHVVPWDSPWMVGRVESTLGGDAATPVRINIKPQHKVAIFVPSGHL